MLYGRTYSCPTGFGAVSAAVDLFEITAAATGIVGLTGLQIGQSSDAGDAEDELLQIIISRVVGAFTSGSGGASVTPAPLDQEGAAASSTCEAKNTTQITGGTATVMFNDSFNVRAGYLWVPTPQQIIIASPTDAIVVALSAPADALTLAATATIEELGT